MQKHLKTIIVLLIVVLVVGFVAMMRSDQRDDSTYSGPGHLAVPLVRDSYFGNTVMLGDDVLMVGVYDGGNPRSPYNEDLYIFEKGPSGWKKTQTLSEADMQHPSPDDLYTPTFELASLYNGRLFVSEGGSRKTYLHTFEKKGSLWKHTDTDVVIDIRSNTSAFNTTRSYLQSFSFFGSMFTLGFHDSFIYPTADSVGGTTRPDDIPTIDSVILFEKNMSGWQEAHRFVTHIDDVTVGPYTQIDGEQSWKWFGGESALGNDMLVVGSDAGDAVFIFEKGGGAVWNQTLKISNDRAGGERSLYVDFQEEMNSTYFGKSVALYGDLLAVGMPRYGDYVDNEDEESHGNRGAVYLFERGESGWEQIARISYDSTELPVALDPEDKFGSSVALFGDLLVVGASGDGEATNSRWFGGCMKMNRGAVYLFERDDQGKWSQVLKISDKQDEMNMWDTLCRPHS